MNSHPFDLAALEYDSAFTNQVPGWWFRNRIWKSMKKVFRNGNRVLDLGCGTGEDAVWMACQGLTVTGIDISSKMLVQARQKAKEAGRSQQITFLQGDLGNLEDHGKELEREYDGALSNFGALNCIEDRLRFSAQLARHIRPGGTAFLVVMGPICPWEIIWFLLRGKGRTAFRRFRSPTLAHVAEGRSIQVWYPSARRLAADFSPYFCRVHTIGLGSLVPPPYLSSLVEKAKGFFRIVDWIEARLGALFPLRWMNDHYLLVLQRTGENPHG